MCPGWIVYDQVIGDFRSLSMRILYVIFVLCVGALVWAAVAAARHIRRHEDTTERQGALPARNIEANSDDEEISLHPEKAHHD
jgi:hypothetical protein